MTDKKIICLLPAATEIICALGLRENLVGISHECDFPENVQDLPVCTSSKVSNESASAEIDAIVKDILSSALSIYDLDTDLISRLNPDVIITQSQCKVCAVSLDEVELAVENLLEKDVEIISLEPATLEDILTDIRRLGIQLQVSESAEALIEDLEERISIIRHKLKFIVEKPSVACVEWLAPVMLAGNWTPGLVDIAGGRAVLVEEGKHSPFVNFENILAENPDILILMPCGFSIERTLKEMNLILDLPGWADLAAVKNNRVYIADGNQYFNRPGPRIVDSIEILAEIIYPKQFSFGYEGSGWIRFNVR